MSWTRTCVCIYSCLPFCALPFFQVTHGCLLSELDTHLRAYPLTSACLSVSCMLLKVTHGRLLSELEALETAMHEAEQEGSARARKPKDQNLSTAVEVRLG